MSVIVKCIIEIGKIVLLLRGMKDLIIATIEKL